VHTMEAFLKILQSFSIELVADIRTYPGSKRLPHFNKQTFSETLQQHGIGYTHIPELGGRRKPKPNSSNIAWRNLSFRGYADHMETPEFKTGIEQLEHLAKQRKVAYMCSEVLWWKCHRALVSDYLKKHGWIVWHIQGENKSEEHPYTAPARARQGSLFGD
jgi:uncharacterized protein (DUF488 family)